MSGQGLVLEKLEIWRQDQRLFSISAKIAPGEILTVTGPSGVGKSTLINAIAGFLSRDFRCSGHILLGGEDVTLLPPEKRRVGVLFQDPLLFPHFSVEENILFALPRGGSMAKRRRRVCQLLDPVGLGELLTRDPATLSGGQQSRVALLRVLAAAPRALLLDEPFSKLDPELRGSVRDFVFSRVRRDMLPTLMVTHDPQDAEAAGGEIIAL